MKLIFEDVSQRIGYQKKYIGSYLLMLFSFVFPMSVVFGNVLALLILIFWVRQGRFSQQWQLLKKNPVVISTLAYVAIQVIGVLWSNDFQWAIVLLKKQWKLLMLPVFIGLLQRSHVRHYIFLFLLSMSISELISYAIWFGLISPFGSATAVNPTPFMSHISYNPFLAFCVFLLLEKLLFDGAVSRLQKLVMLFFLVTISVNMFITGGRAGQVMYLMVIFFVAFQFFKKSLIKSVAFSAFVVPLILVVSYNSSHIFKSRVNFALDEVVNYQKNKESATSEKLGSVGTRLILLENTIEIIKENPIVGVGTGGFYKAYSAVNDRKSPGMDLSSHPHNMYLLVAAQLGLVGLMIFLSIFYSQIKTALKNTDPILKALGVGMPFLFLVIMLSDVYLLGHYTTLLFVFFSAILYKNYDSA